MDADGPTKCKWMKSSDQVARVLQRCITFPIIRVPTEVSNFGITARCLHICSSANFSGKLIDQDFCLNSRVLAAL